MKSSFLHVWLLSGWQLCSSRLCGGYCIHLDLKERSLFKLAFALDSEAVLDVIETKH